MIVDLKAFNLSPNGNILTIARIKTNFLFYIIPDYLFKNNLFNMSKQHTLESNFGIVVSKGQPKKDRACYTQLRGKA